MESVSRELVADVLSVLLDGRGLTMADDTFALVEWGAIARLFNDAGVEARFDRQGVDIPGWRITFDAKACRMSVVCVFDAKAGMTVTGE
jgi:hypothetical protein